ncbi:6-phosphogluconolactonase [Thiolapillus sp.]
MNLEILNDGEAIARLAVEKIREQARRALAARGIFRLALAGGSTPERAYEYLAAAIDDWNGWEFYLGDERCLPVEHSWRNSRMLDEVLFHPAGIETGQIHMIPAELGAEQGAAVYARTIAGVQPFDLVLLGLGEDGHTASLFPGDEHPPQALVVPVHHAPKPPPERISLNYGVLSSARRQLFLVSGKGKYPALKAWREGKDIPAARIRGRDLRILADEAAFHG